MNHPTPDSEPAPTPSAAQTPETEAAHTEPAPTLPDDEPTATQPGLAATASDAEPGAAPATQSEPASTATAATDPDTTQATQPEPAPTVPDAGPTAAQSEPADIPAVAAVLDTTTATPQPAPAIPSDTSATPQPEPASSPTEATLPDASPTAASATAPGDGPTTTQPELADSSAAATVPDAAFSAVSAHGPEQEQDTVSLSGPMPVVVPGPPQEAAAFQQGQWQEAMTTPLPVPTPPRRRTPKPGDPLAVAVANGSLLGVGYAMLGRRVLAVLTALISIALVVVLATAVRTLWLEIVVVVWWVALILHGWYLARRKPALGTNVGKQRIVAVAFALPVLVAFGLLRFDAARIDGDVADAKASGDCAAAQSSLDSRWFGHRVANAPLTEEGDSTVRACGLINTADRELDTALSGDTDALQAGIGHLSTVLTELPGHEKMVGRTLDQFLDALPTKDACDTTDLTDTLRTKDLTGIADTVRDVAPAAIVACADTHMTAEQWEPALERYQQLLEQYPDHGLAAKAQEGVTKATQAIELANVRQLLTLTGAGGQPQYCTSPAGYSAAAPYGAASPNRAMVFGDDHAGRLPPDWMAADAAGAVVVICAGEAQFGTPVETCSYEATPGSTIFTPVTFHRIAVPVRVFELKTGKLIHDTRIEIGGASCPATIFGLENTRYVEPADGDIHAAYSPLINP